MCVPWTDYSHYENPNLVLLGEDNPRSWVPFSSGVSKHSSVLFPQTQAGGRHVFPKQTGGGRSVVQTCVSRAEANRKWELPPAFPPVSGGERAPLQVVLIKSGWDHGIKAQKHKSCLETKGKKGWAMPSSQC